MKGNNHKNLNRSNSIKVSIFLYHKTSKQVSTEEIYGNIIKAIREKPKATMIMTGKR